MTTQQNDAMAMTDQELDQVHGGLGWLLRWILKKDLEGAERVVGGLDKVQDAADASMKEN